MRSEERAGIVAVILLFLWGTLITEPLRLILDIFCEMLTGTLVRIGLPSDGLANNVVVILVFAVVGLGLTILSKTELSDYIPLVLTCGGMGVFLVRTLITGRMETGKLVAFSVVLIILAALYFLSLKTPLLWITDLFVFSPAVFLVAGLILRPLWKISDITSVLFYSGRLQSVDLAERFDSLLKLPGLVWGIFICVILLLPTVYYSAGRKKG